MGHTCLGFSKAYQLFICKMDSMGKPYIRSNPAQALHILQRTHMETLQCIILLIHGLCQMSVQSHIQLSCQHSTFFQQFTGHTERRTWCKCHLMHGIWIWIMVFLYRFFAVSQNLINRLNDTVRR